MLLCHNDGCRWPGAEWVPGHQQPPCWPHCDECHMIYIIQHADQIIIINQIKKKQHITFFVIGDRNWPWCIAGWSGWWWYNYSTRDFGPLCGSLPQHKHDIQVLHMACTTTNSSQIAKFMGPIWGPPGSCWPQMGPMLAPWTLLSGMITISILPWIWSTEHK